MQLTLCRLPTRIDFVARQISPHLDVCSIALTILEMADARSRRRNGQSLARQHAAVDAVKYRHTTHTLLLAALVAAEVTVERLKAVVVGAVEHSTEVQAEVPEAVAPVADEAAEYVIERWTKMSQPYHCSQLSVPTILRRSDSPLVMFRRHRV